MNCYKISVFLIAAFLILSCGSIQQPLQINTGNAMQLDSLPGLCPYLTKDSKGRIFASWARMVNDSTAVFSYAVSADEGRSFARAATIPFSDNLKPHSENLPKMIIKPSGEIIALWGSANPNPANKYSGTVYYCQSFDDGASWTKPVPLVKDTAGYDQRYYDVALLPSGEAAVIWLDNRKSGASDGSALYFTSTSGRDGFMNEKIITEGCCQCCRTALYIDKRSGIHVLYRGIIQDSIRDMLHSVSVDGGHTFSSPQRISNDNWVLRGCPHTGPAMSENAQGLHFAWFTGGRSKGCFYTRSGDNGSSFSPRDRISEQGSHPQISCLSNGEVLVAWDEPVQVGSNSYRQISLQLRTANGSKKAQVFIKPDTSVSAYPVLMPVANNRCLVAYTTKRRGQTYIMWNRTSID